MKAWLAFGTAALLFPSATLSAAPKPPPATVEAGGQSCIVWEFVRNVRGVFDSSYVQFRNKCPARVSFFWCKDHVFKPGVFPPCDAHRGAYSMTTAERGWTNKVSASTGGRLVIVIRECPAGYTARAKTDGRFHCRL